MRRHSMPGPPGSAALVALLFLVVSGCATVRPPLRLDPMFSQRGIRSIALLPIVDRRKDRSANLDVEYEVSARARKALERKGYHVVAVPGPSEDDPIGTARLLEADLDYLVLLNPPEADAVIAIYVDDSLSSYKVLSYAFKVEALGVMVSRSANVELWRAKGIGNAGQAGLISGVLQGLYRSEAWDACVYGMLSSIPKAAVSSVAPEPLPDVAVPEEDEPPA